ncbi:MAG: tetratricopeptide repeat protein [Promethearchaeota archaeon]
MSYPELIELTKAEQLFDDGKLDEALQLLNDNNQFEGLNFQQKSYFQGLKGLILIYQNKNIELIELGELMLKEGQDSKENLQSFDGLLFILFGLDQEKKFEEALNRIGQAETLLGLISNVPKNVISQRELRLNVLKTLIDIHTGKIDKAEKCLEELLRSQNEHDIMWELMFAFTNMTFIQLIIRGRYDLALEYTEKAMTQAKKTKFNHYWLGYCHCGIGVIHAQKCEYDLSFKHYMKSLAYFKQINNIWFIANLYNNLGGLHCIKGEFDIALNYLEEAIILWEPYPLLKDACLDTLIWVSLEKGDDERAQKYFHCLENLVNEKKDRHLEVLYQYNKALMLKRSTRIRDKAKAEELLKQVIETEGFYFETTISAYINLCDLLLAEFRVNNNTEVLEELYKYIDNLLTIAETSHSYFIFCNTFILQAKLALITLDLKAARRFLTQAQKIAESYGIKRLAMKISYEHDELLKKSKMWENLKESEIPLSERWKLAGLSEEIENLVKKRMITVPEASKEEPVLLLIVSEGGVPFFSHSFIEDKTFESHLFGGFLTTIDYFIKEMFSEGLDRAVFGEHTLLMKALPPFFISYVFKGDSYYALQKLDYFNNRLEKEGEIWQNLLTSFQKNTTIQLKDEPLLETIITETFIAKNIIFG